MDQTHPCIVTDDVANNTANQTFTIIGPKNDRVSLPIREHSLHVAGSVAFRSVELFHVNTLKKSKCTLRMSG